MHFCLTSTWQIHRPVGISHQQTEVHVQRYNIYTQVTYNMKSSCRSPCAWEKKQQILILSFHTMHISTLVKSWSDIIHLERKMIEVEVEWSRGQYAQNWKSKLPKSILCSSCIEANLVINKSGVQYLRFQFYTLVNNWQFNSLIHLQMCNTWIKIISTHKMTGMLW